MLRNGELHVIGFAISVSRSLAPLTGGKMVPHATPSDQRAAAALWSPERASKPICLRVTLLAGHAEPADEPMTGLSGCPRSCADHACLSERKHIER